MKKIGVLTGGVDCPGMNSVIRAVVRKSVEGGFVVTGIKNGWSGLVENDMRVLDIRSTDGILDKGGTILGTSIFSQNIEESLLDKMDVNFKKSGIDAIIAVGGEDTLKIALELYNKKGVSVVGVPKSIDNALFGTDYAFGFDTAVNIATECIDRLHTTAEAHHRIMVIEVMGRHTGWIAVQAGIAGGAHMILIPEYVVDMDKVCEALRARHKRGQTFSIIVVSEGTRISGHEVNNKLGDRRNSRSRFSKVGELVANLIEEKTQYETRVSVLGHIQRGGAPSSYDRVISTRFGVKAVELVQNNEFGRMVSSHGNVLTSVNIEEAVKEFKLVDSALYDIACLFSA